MKEDKQIQGVFLCQKCNLLMASKQAGFSYLGRTFRADILKCPKCGLVFIPEELVQGRMKEVETLIEEK